MHKSLLALAQSLHRFPFLRRLARRVAAGRMVKQAFHGGVICADAVEHSWAWTGSRRLEDFDRALQDRLLDLTSTRPTLLDIGSNLGVMTLSVLLRRREVRAVAVDPNRRAIELLSHSLRQNGLEARAQTLCCAASSGTSSLPYTAEGSFVGHVADQGNAVPAVPLLELIARHAAAPAVIKIDVEGYEAVLAESLARLPRLPGSALVLELHPRGFNGMGDPTRVVSALRSRTDLTVGLQGGGDIAAFNPAEFHQLEVFWPNE